MIEIRKKNVQNIWEHVDTVNTRTIFLSKAYFIANNNTFELTELNGSDNIRTTIDQIRVYDEPNGGSAETFPNALALETRLRELGYPFFDESTFQPASDLISSDANNQLQTGTDNLLFVPSSGGGSGEPSDGDKGDVVVSNNGLTWTVKDGVVDTSIFSNLPSDGVIHIGLTGQSNADGRALNADAPASEIKDYTNFKIWNSGTSTYQDYNPSSGGATMHNIFLALAKWFEDNYPLLTIYTCEYAVGGTGIDQHLAGGSVYTTFWNNHYRPSVDNLVAANNKVYTTLLFFQGEFDSNTTTTAFEYKDKHQRWIDLWEETVNIQMPIICSEIIETNTNDQIINQSITVNGRNNINVLKLLNNGAGTDDNLHYNYAGFQTLAPRFTEILRLNNIWNIQKESILDTFLGELPNTLTYDFTNYTPPTTDATKFEDKIGTHEIVNVNSSNRLRITGTTATGNQLITNAAVQCMEFLELQNIDDLIFDFAASSVTSMSRAGIFFRASETTNFHNGYLVLIYDSTSARMYTMNDGSLTQIAVGNLAQNIINGADNHFRITAFGSELSFMHSTDGGSTYQSVISVTNSTYTTGFMGMSGNFASTGDDFYIDNITAMY